MDEMENSPQYSPTLDRILQVTLGKYTHGISPAALLLAFYDWYLHFILHPAKHIELINLALENYWHFYKLLICQFLSEKKPYEDAIYLFHDKRFASEGWQSFPYTILYESFLMIQNWWQQAIINTPGLSHHHEEVMKFLVRQFLDMISPSNFPALNPEVLMATQEQQGLNFLKGLENFIDDIRRFELDLPPEGADHFIVGKDVALTEGSVIYRNRLIELIQYTPQTSTVYAEPILITPAWIMKYYILDLTPRHSLVKYLVKKGHTVFMISWKNPKKKDRNIGMEDYLHLGIFDSIDIVEKITGQHKIHLVGYCLGGTLSAIAAAAMARDNDNRLATLTLLAAQTDFNEPGELGLFIDESQITFLENLMRDKGYLDTHQMAGAFQLLRSNDLIWSRMIQDYLLGRRKPLTDLMAWNADATRLPFKMHSEYLRQLFLKNQLAEGNYHVDNKAISLTDITIPIFVVSTERDHVSPWHSVFKINMLTSSNVTFVLTSGGHNVGIVSMPVRKTKRHYRISHFKESDRYIDADNWFKHTKSVGGSWWPALEKWLVEHSTVKKIHPPPMKNKKYKLSPLEAAPGTYVLEK